MKLQVKNKPILWTISGSDCSGGAGIAADIKTGHQLGIEVCHLITANTVQNAQKLVSVNPVEISILSKQVQTLLEDKAPHVIKVGLLANHAQITWLIALLQQLKTTNSELLVIFDPVGSASVGGKFNDFDTSDLNHLWPLIDVITPNLPEAQAITGLTTSDTEQLAKSLCSKGLKSAIVKGGHCQTQKTMDIAYVNNSKMVYRVLTDRVETSFSHGSGCSFASAIASFLALGYLLRDALTLTKAFIQQGLELRSGEQDYYGAFEQTSWPEQKQYFPEIKAPIHEKYAQLPAFANLESIRGTQSLGLYPVIDSLEWLEQILPLGVEIIQLRIKNKSEQELDDIISQAVTLSRNHSTRLFINDYWQLAIKHGAYGVHIGQEDLLDADLNAIQQAGLRLGISTHGYYEFLLAQQLKPSYLAVGAIFPTTTKDMTGQIQGIDNLEQILALTTDIPVVAIGGINLARAKSVWKTGVDAIAVVSAITQAESPKIAVNNFQNLLNTKCVNEKPTSWISLIKSFF